MNEPGTRSSALGNVFKGWGGIDTGLIDNLRGDTMRVDLKRVRLVRGHFPLGVREYLPRYVSKGRQLHCFTFLREPVDRTLSQYFAIRARLESPDPPPDKSGLPPLPAEPTLDDMLERGYLHDSLQTRMLSGLLEPFGEVTDAMLEQAKHNLREGVAFFGLTERFDESLVIAKQRLGFRVLLYGTDSRVNVTRPRGDEVPEELFRAAVRCNRYDTELYDFAQKLFEGLPEREELEFAVELAALRAVGAKGEIEPGAPPPKDFAGGAEVWKMLVEARALSFEVYEAEGAVVFEEEDIDDDIGDDEIAGDDSTPNEVMRYFAPVTKPSPGTRTPNWPRCASTFSASKIRRSNRGWATSWPLPAPTGSTLRPTRTTSRSRNPVTSRSWCNEARLGRRRTCCSARASSNSCRSAGSPSRRRAAAS